MRVHKLTLAAALVAAAGLSLTACDDGGGAGQSAPSSAATTSSSAGGSDTGGSGQGAGKGSGGKDSAGKSSAGQGTAAGSGSDGSGEGGKPGKCRTDELEITAMDSTIDGDPEGTVAVQLTNGGGRVCVLSGYAGVDLRTNAGTLSAKRTGERATPITLKSGKSVAFGITYPFDETGGSGVRITGLLVTPPNETKTVTLAWPGAATLPVTDGSGSPVKVGPLGSAGQGD
ncbi:DUF4232 domain-containing protein [Streptomyces sp. NPDC085481]|uniref:DUF4232 domain-containing protein n=1 Tax=Streptomyces sp. NPDC085481 TaxID=3365727 RepID=UPI0037D3D8BF